MKTMLALTLISGLLTAGGSALARDNTDRTLAPITIHRDTLPDCTPPSPADVCASLHAQIRHVFSKREIGMLFGHRTSYADYWSSYDLVHARYQAFLRDIESYGQPAVALVIR
ncbi:MAG TPA: hypothetical protein VGC55_05480 [Dokdonella sp.]